MLAAARKRSPAESIVIANSWEPQQGYITANDALDLFLSHIAARPYDTNFIVEFAKPGRSGTGGNGYGTATCE